MMVVPWGLQEYLQLKELSLPSILLSPAGPHP